MAKVLAKSYTSPSLVFLAFDWPDGPKTQDFLGFAIERDPGFGKSGKPQFLFNKIGFGDPEKDPGPHPSNKAPIQKFHWWDSGINSTDRGKTFHYTITPVRGTGPDDLNLVSADATKIAVKLPLEEEDGIGTYFNRAVVSSQSFDDLVKKTKDDPKKEMDWLANGLQNPIPNLLDGTKQIAGAIYHLTDNRWVVPAFKKLKGTSSMVFHLKEPTAKAKASAKAKGKKPSGDTADLPAVKLLSTAKRTFDKRTKTNIMHHKFLVNFAKDTVLMGSTNFTPEAFTVQANLLHTIRSKQLAGFYADRQKLLQPDPTKGETAKEAKWLKVSDVPGSKIRVFFSPEPKNQRESINAVVESVKHAKSSVLFCMFSPTDKELLSAIMKSGDQGKMMFGLLNSIVDPTKKKKKIIEDPDAAMVNPSPSQEILTEVFHRSQNKKDIVSFAFFGDKSAKAPVGFLPELQTKDFSQFSLSPPPKGNKIPTVHIHHKFIVIDADTNSPTIYTGSANMSKNSVENNDENLLEIKGNTQLAQAYLAEFFRLYEHYRARALWNRRHAKKVQASKKKSTKGQFADGFRLKTKRDLWARAAYQNGTLDFISRQRLVGK
ncbi:MAG TPA: phospholipase D-like domain-containing protein [Pyrinomonadaceae bacterium]